MNRYSVLAFLAISCLLIFSCGDGSYESKTYFENRTGHKITIEPYGANNSIEIYRYDLAANDVKLVVGDKGRGSAIGYTYADIGDSIVVTFDDTLKVSHLGMNKKAIPRSYAYEHPRNLKNRNNYTYKILESSKKFTSNEYRYIFTPEDYQDAVKLNK